MRLSVVMISSITPSPKYSCSGSHAGCHSPVLGRITAPGRAGYNPNQGNTLPFFKK
jgi:hypothetical protein